MPSERATSPSNGPRVVQLAALWAYDKSGRYPPQFVGAVAESLRDAWYEHSEELRKLAEQWWSDWDGRSEWEFDVAYHDVTTPERSNAS